MNAGALEMARIVETLTPMLISINVRYKAAAGHPDHGPARGRPLGGVIERCVILAGGTGGAKLAAGMQDLLGSGLSVIANTADDIEIAGVDVSPDPDLITYWLSGEIDEERGWGIKGDSFTIFDRLVRLGAPDWFRLSDRDLATCLYRRVFVAEGGTPHRRPGADRPRARSTGGGPADVRGAGAHPGQDRRRAGAVCSSTWSPSTQRRRWRTIEVEGIADATPTPRCWRRSPRPRRSSSGRPIR